MAVRRVDRVWDGFRRHWADTDDRWCWPSAARHRLYWWARNRWRFDRGPGRWRLDWRSPDWLRNFRYTAPRIDVDLGVATFAGDIDVEDRLSGGLGRPALSDHGSVWEPISNALTGITIPIGYFHPVLLRPPPQVFKILR
ncbi:hypothetical protein LAUMK4_04394 [Mycobacterium persicum]|uniref:Uncharacterized protein n=1 Tax=Mycobacterium persicum TaxID=1487726 RepID=A0AB38UXR9_9MYCO|nr:hypothetical protein LAUMK15_04805 [Mycobacterium persicum]VAZ85634.1 hypothetical protein LAUMK42_04472 [Mycobacterium persicum]VAZ98885.1 hypothetical protein LAUMK4_04394 [Mycobacterium persicum]